MNKQAAILLALFHDNHMTHTSYVREKIHAVLIGGANESILDTKNLPKFKELMGEENNEPNE